MYAVKDFKNCCRLCVKDLSTHQASAGGENGYFRITEHRALQLMILNCFEIVITDDEVVDKICSSCKDEVHQVDTIRRKVQTADCEIRDFYDWLKIVDEIKGLDNPSEKPIIVSCKVEPELALESDDEQKISPSEDDTEGESSVQEMDHEEEDETESLVVKYEYENRDSTKKVNETDAEKGLIKKSSKPLHKTNPVGRKYKEKEPKFSYSDYRCFICSTDFANQDELSTHLATHVNPNNFQKCSICNLEMVTVRNLNAHLRRTHFRTGKLFPCEECRENGIVREFSSNFILRAHKRTVHEGIVKTPVKSYVCSHCGKKFTRLSSLRIHENTHTNAKSYKCKQCSATFSKKTILNRHEDIHTAGKPFVCDQCGTAFRRAFNLQMHKANRHNDDRPFGCETCGARFKVRMALSSHLRTHSHGTKSNQHS